MLSCSARTVPAVVAVSCPHSDSPPATQPHNRLPASFSYTTVPPNKVWCNTLPNVQTRALKCLNQSKRIGSSSYTLVKRDKCMNTNPKSVKVIEPQQVERNRKQKQSRQNRKTDSRAFVIANSKAFRSAKTESTMIS